MGKRIKKPPVLADGYLKSLMAESLNSIERKQRVVKWAASFHKTEYALLVTIFKLNTQKGIIINNIFLNPAS